MKLLTSLPGFSKWDHYRNKDTRKIFPVKRWYSHFISAYVLHLDEQKAP